MSIDLTALFTAVITVIIAIISKYAVPFLKAKLANVKKDDLVFWVEIAVKAAEQLAKNGTIQKSGRKDYVKEFLVKKGFSLDTSEVDNLIESFVNDLPSQLTGVETLVSETDTQTNEIVKAAAEMIVSANEKEKAISDAEVDKAKAEAQKAKAEADKAKAEAAKVKDTTKKK